MACCGIWELSLFCAVFGSCVTSLTVFVWSLIYWDWMQCESFMNKYALCFYTTLNLSQFILTWRHCRGLVRFPSDEMIYCLCSWENKVIRKTIVKKRRKRKHEKVTSPRLRMWVTAPDFSRRYNFWFMRLLYSLGTTQSKTPAMNSGLRLAVSWHLSFLLSFDPLHPITSLL